MTFYENSAKGSWFLRNEKGQIVSPNFTTYGDLLDWVNSKSGAEVIQEFGVDTERELAEAGDMY